MKCVQSSPGGERVTGGHDTVRMSPCVVTNHGRLRQKQGGDEKTR